MYFRELESPNISQRKQNRVNVAALFFLIIYVLSLKAKLRLVFFFFWYNMIVLLNIMFKFSISSLVTHGGDRNGLKKSCRIFMLVNNVFKMHL